jgi:hypothetical protein
MTATQPMTWITPIATAFGAVAGACGLWVANRMMGKAAFQTAINSGFEKLTDQLQEERKALTDQLDAERLAWSSERAQLRGDIINLTQAVESLKAYLRRNGLDIPEVYRAPSEVAVIRR